MQAPGAKPFLDSVARNSKNTSKAYASALLYFQLFLQSKKYTLQTVIKPLSTDKLNVYELLDAFVAYLINMISEETQHHLSRQSISLYVTAVRSYLAYNDIDVIPAKFKRKVRVPKVGREDEQAIDASDIRKILLACNNRRLKSYLLILASSGCRTTEAASIRLLDIDFDTIPTTISIRKNFTKTKVARNIYISNEASDHLRQWIAWKYRSKQRIDTDLVFITKDGSNVSTLYNKLLLEFNKVLKMANMDARKEGELRRKITMHSLRRYVKTIVADQVNSDYSEWFIGHSKSSYYGKKEPARRELYTSKCMKYLTFLDYSLLEKTGKGIEASLQMKDKEMEDLRKQVKSLQESRQDPWQELTSESREKLLEEFTKHYEKRIRNKDE